jgi:predicted DNA-binding protein (MmcQ/YjbR family)
VSPARTVTAKQRKAMARCKEFALSMPGAWEDHPWGDTVVKVGKKIFVFMGIDGDDAVGASVKLPDSREQALSMAGTEPTGYGLGRAGWVSARFGPGEDVPVDIMCDWIEESYRAVAPKKLVAELDRRAGG